MIVLNTVFEKVENSHEYGVLTVADITVGRIPRILYQTRGNINELISILSKEYSPVIIVNE